MALLAAVPAHPPILMLLGGLVVVAVVAYLGVCWWAWLMTCRRTVLVS